MNRNPSNSISHRSPSNSLPLLIAITGFVNYKTAQGLSQRSVDSYKRILDQWAEYAGNQKIAQITDGEINKYLVYMRTEYVPRRFNGIHSRFLQSRYETSGSPCALSSPRRIPSFDLKIQ